MTAPSDPAFALASVLDSVAQTKGTPAAVSLAGDMIVAGTATLVRERGARFAYDTIVKLSDDIALQFIARRIDCGKE